MSDNTDSTITTTNIQADEVQIKIVEPPITNEVKHSESSYSLNVYAMII